MDDKVMTGASMPIELMREVVSEQSQNRENAFKASELITTDLAAQHVKKQSKNKANELKVEDLSVAQGIKTLIKTLFPAQYIETTIVTEDRKVLQYVAEANNKVKVTQVLNACKNAKTLGLKATLMSVNGNERELKETNIESLSDLIGEKLTDKALDTIIDELNISEEKLTTTLFHWIFPESTKIGKIGNKVLGKVFFIYDLYSKLKDVGELIGKTQERNNENAYKLWCVSTCLTLDPAKETRLFNHFRGYLQVFLSEYGGITYQNLISSAEDAITTKGIFHIYRKVLNQIASINIEILSIIF